MTGSEAVRIVRAEVGSTNVDKMAAYIYDRDWDYEIGGGRDMGHSPHRASIRVYLMGRTARERELMEGRVAGADSHGGKASGGLHSGTTRHGLGPSPRAGGTTARWALVGALAAAITVYGPKEVAS